MAVVVEIRDGTPWYLSPDIWVVPGDDPNGPPGSPVSGQNNYLWGRVRNTGSSRMTGGRVDFYWANPATAVLRSSATFVGSAYVDLDAGEVKEVLCITPWVAVVVNDGHECVVAQAIHGSDPLPTPLHDAFDPPTYHQIAQRNLSVLTVAPMMAMILPIQLSAPRRRAKALTLSISREPARLDGELLAGIGLRGHKPAERADIEVGFVATRSCEPQDVRSRLELKLAPGTARAAFLHVRAKAPFEGYALVHVEERVDGRSTGGLSFAILSRKG